MPVLATDSARESISEPWHEWPVCQEYPTTRFRGTLVCRLPRWCPHAVQGRATVNNPQPDFATGGGSTLGSGITYAHIGVRLHGVAYYANE